MKEFMPFIDSRLKIGWNKNIGYGVFSSGFIRKGEFLELAPVVLVDKKPEDDNLFKYIMHWDNKLALPLGWTMLYNHSDDNCCEFSTNLHEGLLAVVAIRDIAKESQITVNYGSEWFSSRSIEKVLL
jgi:SET domain-containing protein